MIALALAVASASWGASLARADVKLAGIFGEGMVIQRDLPARVWGSAAPGEAVRVSLGKESASTVADEHGRWSVELPAQKSGAAVELRVTGKNEIRLRDVRLGEVWLAAGQSNMLVPLSAARDGAAEVAHLSSLDLRLFVVREKPSDTRDVELEGGWTTCRAESAETLSAVAYFFAHELKGHVDAPIGIVQAAVGGSVAEAWTDPDALKSDERLAPSLARFARAAKSHAGALFDGMIAPLAPFSLRGVIWYQGESNVGFASQYELLFPALIGSWRRAFGREDLPFLFVQLPGSGPVDAGDSPPEKSGWAELREAQAKALALPGTAMAVAIDVGDVDLHPPRKREVGERLARLARATVYGDAKVQACGPSYSEMSVAGDQVTLRFDHAEGLRARDHGKLAGFALAGEDRHFVRAEARIEDGRVLVRSPGLGRPMFVRYAWADNPICNLENGAGLPAAPFRTDGAR